MIDGVQKKGNNNNLVSTTGTHHNFVPVSCMLINSFANRPFYKQRHSSSARTELFYIASLLIDRKNNNARTVDDANRGIIGLVCRVNSLFNNSISSNHRFNKPPVVFSVLFRGRDDLVKAGIQLEFKHDDTEM